MSFNTETNREKITWMYKTVLNHTYEGKLKITSHVTNLDYYGKWNYAQKTHLVYQINGDAPIIIQNIPATKYYAGIHAENQMIEKLNKKGKEKKTNGSSSLESEVTELFTKMSIKPMSITIYINNSPCSQSPHECTSKLIEYLDSNVNVHLRLYVASLYNICRESCKEEYHNEHITPTKHEANYRGLRNLMQHGRCEIMAFTEDIWKQLFEMTTGSDQLPDDYDNMKDGNDRSRKDEDERIQTDLNHIRNNEL